MWPRGARVGRFIILAHRYLGIGLGVLMALWCLSGIVMIYVPYPMILDSERVAALPAINWSGCCVLKGTGVPADTDRLRGFELEMLGDLPVLRLTMLDGEQRILSLRTGDALGDIGRQQAWEAAARFGASRLLSMKEATYESLDYDQWTVGGFRTDRPLHRIAFHDPEGTEIYVSSKTGKVVQVTTRFQRFWSWVGAVPHWLYPSILRKHPEVWVQVVIYTSLLGSFLTVTGLYIGIRHLRRRALDGALGSPYRGLMYWHHVPGLVFGAFALTWVMSGLLSMNPWGLMESEGPGPARERVQGGPLPWPEARSLIESVPRNAPGDVVSIRSVRLNGQSYAVSSTADGLRQRFSLDGRHMPLTSDEIQSAARLLAPADQPFSWRRIDKEDSYHYSVGRQHAVLPAIRVSVGSSPHVLFYLDALSGELIDMADGAGRAYRWWHSALHRLDVTPSLRTPLARTLLMLPLLLGATFVCALGAYLGIRRVRR